MVEVGKMNHLKVVKQVDFGLYLEGGEDGEILLPNNSIPDGWEVDAYLDVFIYLDSEDRLIATTQTPFIEVGSSALLTVVGKSKFGSFLDWGLAKDLLVPFKEQRIPMLEGKSYVVHAYLDSSERIAGTSKLSRHITETDDDEQYTKDDKVSLLIATRTDMGYKAVINDSHLGLLHASDIHQHIEVGDKLDGFIKLVRDDGRIDLALALAGMKGRGELADRIIAELQANGGSLSIGDKSEPAAIRDRLGVSKSAWKKALGGLYKDRIIEVEAEKVTLI